MLEGMVKGPQQARQLPYILAAFLDAHTLLLHEPRPASQAELRQADPKQADPGQANLRPAEPSQAESSPGEAQQADAQQAEPRPASQADVLSLTQVKLVSMDAEL